MRRPCAPMDRSCLNRATISSQDCCLILAASSSHQFQIRRHWRRPERRLAFSRRRLKSSLLCRTLTGPSPYPASSPRQCVAHSKRRRSMRNRAPVAGSGKSKLVEYASVIATGEITPVIAQGPNDEETEKRLASCIIEGRSIVAIDNCTRPLADIDLLCQMLTANKVSPRILGVSKTSMLTAGALVTATGNGLRIVGDLVRRTILCDIDPGCEEPEGREFDFDPIQVAKSKRAELVIAALTILRAFHVAERPAPEGVSPLGSFEDWSLLVRNALIWLGCADPVASQRNLRKDDPMKARLEDVMAQWWDTFGNDNVIAADVIQSACEQESSGYGNGKFIRPLLRDALLAVAGRGGSVNSRALGEWLSGNKGRIADGRCFEIDEKKQNGVAVWRLVEKDTR